MKVRLTQSDVLRAMEEYVTRNFGDKVSVHDIEFEVTRKPRNVEFILDVQPREDDMPMLQKAMKYPQEWETKDIADMTGMNVPSEDINHLDSSEEVEEVLPEDIHLQPEPDFLDGPDIGGHDVDTGEEKPTPYIPGAAVDTNSLFDPE